VTEPVWLTRLAVDILHHDQLVEHGGTPGTRDENLLESTLARPPNRWHYGQTRDLVDLAAVYGHGLTRGHPYADGNKRIGFLAMAVFLDLNGLRLEAPDKDVVDVMQRVAAGALSEHRLAAWIRAHALERAG
jgi:death on curing protein